MAPLERPAQTRRVQSSDAADPTTALAARGLLWATLVAGVVGLIACGPIELGGLALQQADTRALGMLPNAVNVLSHLPLLLAALVSSRACIGLANQGPRRVVMWARGWALAFGCVALGALGGAAFHARPTVVGELLVGAAIGSASALVALLFLAERLSPRLLRDQWLLAATLSGLLAALAAAAANDLRGLVALEYLPLVLVPLAVWRLPSRGIPNRDWIVAFFINMAAHLASWADAPIWRMTPGTVGGLALSHLLLALCVAWLARCALGAAPLQPRDAPARASTPSQDSTSLTTSG
jgi:hypothetical protein